MVLQEHAITIAKRILPYNFRRTLRLAKWKLMYDFSSESGDYFCPVLNESVKTFIKNKHQLLTYKNEALSRHRIIMDYLRNHTQILSKTIDLLHIAPEPCLSDVFLPIENINYIGLDKFEDGYDYPSWVQNGDLTNLPFDNHSYDLVLCNHVLEHIHEDVLAMSELYRVLKQGGFAIITVPIDAEAKHTKYDASITEPNERKKRYGQWDHVRMYSLDITEKLTNIGFEVESLHYRSWIGEEEANRFGIQSDYLFLCKKTSSK